MTAAARLLLALAAAAACAPSAAPPPVAPPLASVKPPTPSPPAASVLDLAPASLAWDGPHGPILALDAAGFASLSSASTAFLAVPFARLTPSGELQRADGTPFLTIDAAGSIIVQGTDYGFVVKRDGTAWQRGQKLDFSIAEDGTVWGTDPRTGSAAIRTDMQYAGPPGARRAIILAKITLAIWLAAPQPEPAVSAAARPTSILTCDAYAALLANALRCVARDETTTRELRIAVARIDGFAGDLPAWGRDATAAACSLGAIRLKAYYATKNCPL